MPTCGVLHIPGLVEVARFWTALVYRSLTGPRWPARGDDLDVDPGSRREPGGAPHDRAAAGHFLPGVALAGAGWDAELDTEMVRLLGGAGDVGRLGGDHDARPRRS